MTRLAPLTVYALGVLVLSCLSGCSDSGGSTSSVGDTGGGGSNGGGDTGGGGGDTGGGGSNGGGGGNSWTSGSYTGPGFQVSGFESATLYPSVQTTPDGALWVGKDTNLARISPTGELVDAWRVDASPGLTGVAVTPNGIESEVELWAFDESSIYWGPILPPGALPTTVKRIQGFTGDVAATSLIRASDGAPWLAVSYRSEPAGLRLAKITSDGEIAWTVGFNKWFSLSPLDDGSILLVDNADSNGLNIARVSSTGSIVYQRALPGFTNTGYPLEGQESLLLTDIDTSAPGDFLVRVAVLSLNSGQVTDSWQITPPNGWKWGEWPRVLSDPTGIILCGVLRPDPPLSVGAFNNAGAGLAVCKYTHSGALSWMRELRLGSAGAAPYFSGFWTMAGGTTPVISWSGYPEASFFTSNGSTWVDSGDLVTGFTALSGTNGSHWSRRDWQPSYSLAPGGGGTDLVLHDGENISRFSSSGVNHWTRSLPPELDYFFGVEDLAFGYEYAPDPASSTGQSIVHSKHSMGPSGPSGFRLGSLTPLRVLTPWYQVADAPGLAIGARSTTSGYRPLVARVDSQGRPTNGCMGASMNYGAASTPGTPYSLMTGNAPAPTKTNLNLSTENRDFATSANFTISNYSLMLTPIPASLLSPCD